MDVGRGGKETMCHGKRALAVGDLLLVVCNNTRPERIAVPLPKHQMLAKTLDAPVAL